MAGWLTLEETRDRWRDAPADDDYLQELLNASAEQILAYGRADVAARIGTGEQEVPDSYRLAQLTQTRNIWNAVKLDPSSGGIGDEGFVFRPFPLDWTVKQIIRPQTAKPVVA